MAPCFPTVRLISHVSKTDAGQPADTKEEDDATREDGARAGVEVGAVTNALAAIQIKVHVNVSKLIIRQGKADDDSVSASDPSGSDIKEPADPKNPDTDVIVPEIRTGVNAAAPAGKTASELMLLRPVPLSVIEPDLSGAPLQSALELLTCCNMSKHIT